MRDVVQPASGFYCPGRANDFINEVPGSKPILVEGGAHAVTEMK